MKKRLIIFLIAISYSLFLSTIFQQPAIAAPNGPCCKDPAVNRYVPGKGCYATKEDSQDPNKKPDKDLFACSTGEVCDASLANPVCMPLASPIPDNCLDAAGKRTPNTVDTALGCIEVTPGNLISVSIRIGVGIGSGIAFLLIIYGTYKIMRSQGNPEGINSGKETITSAIIGLVFIILSVTVLQVIGFDVLGLDAFGLGSR